MKSNQSQLCHFLFHKEDSLLCDWDLTKIKDIIDWFGWHTSEHFPSKHRISFSEKSFRSLYFCQGKSVWIHTPSAVLWRFYWQIQIILVPYPSPVINSRRKGTSPLSLVHWPNMWWTVSSRCREPISVQSAKSTTRRKTKKQKKTKPIDPSNKGLGLRSLGCVGIFFNYPRLTWTILRHFK